MELDEKIVQEFEKRIDEVAKEPFCVFKTNLPEQYRIEEKTIQINSNLSDRDLNNLLCKLIQAEKGIEEDEATYNFEFLLNEDFIKGTLKSHLIKHQIPPEEVLVIHYCFSLEKPKLEKTMQEEDWIWDISKFVGVLDEKGFYGVAHFDGSVSIYNEDDKRMSKFQIVEDGSVRALRIVPNSGSSENNYYLITGSSDETVRISWLYAGQKKIASEPRYIGKGHQGGIECLDFDPVNHNFFVSGGADKVLRIWKFEHKEAEKPSKDSKTTKKVKQPVEEIEPHHSSQVHEDEISRVIWARSETIISGSQDHTIRFFDTVKQRESLILNCKDNVVTALGYHDNLVISGHEDAYVKVWDERNSNKQPIKILKAHGKWVSAAKFHPNNPQLFLTGSYDSTVKLWDIRSTFPLVVLKDQKEKIFSVEWNGDSHFLTGGSDSKIMGYKFDNRDK